MDRLGAMQQFVEVVDGGSFSAAARRRGQGQPALSKAIAQLEERLGTRLLVRSTRALTLTDAGRIFYDRARAAIDAADEAEAAARGSGAALAGRLRVCAPVTLARLHIVPRLGDLLRDHPGLELDLVLDDRRVDLVEEGIDVALRVGALEDSALLATRIATGRRHVLATPGYWAEHGLPGHPGDLARHRAIVYRDGVDWRFHDGDATAEARLAAYIRVSAAEGQRAAVLAGLGLTIASRWLFAAELADGTVTRALPGWTPPHVDLWTVFPAGRRVSARARLFAAFLKDLFNRV